MARECGDCGESFGTLSALRLHDCPADEDADGDDWEREVEEHMAEIRRREREGDRMAERAASSEFTEALDAAGADDTGAVHRALAQYERHLATEWAKSDDSDDRCYWGFHRVFEEPAVSALDEAVVAEGWPFLLDVLEAYWPTVSQDIEGYPDAPDDRRLDRDGYDEYPHVGHVLTLVTGRQLVRTRRLEDVDGIPAQALEFQRYFHRHPSDNGPWLRSLAAESGVVEDLPADWQLADIVL